MEMVIILLITLLVLGVAAKHWGFDSTAKIDSPEWERRRQWSMLPGCARHDPIAEKAARDRRWAGGDHDLPYSFTLPNSVPQVRAWMKLLLHRQDGAFQP